MTEPNTNCLAGMQCPKCKSLGPFSISATALFTMNNDGTDNFGSVEYDGESYCQCTQCDHDGIVHNFRTEDRHI